MNPQEIANPNSDVKNILGRALYMAQKRGVNNLEQTKKVDQLARDSKKETADFPRVNQSTTMASPYAMDSDAVSPMSTSPTSD